MVAIFLVLIMVITMAAAVVRADSADDSSDTAETVTVDTSAESAAADSEQDKLNSGIYIENVNVTGMTETQIQNAIDTKLEELCSQIIVLYAGNRSVKVSAGDFGLTYTNTGLAAEAYSIGRTGNIFKRFQAERYLSTVGDIVLNLDLTVSRSKVLSVIQQNETYLNCDAHSNGLKLNSDYTFSLTGGQDGVTINETASVDAVIDYIENEWHGGQGGISLSAEIESFSDETEQLNQVRDLLGSGSTTYYTGDTNHDTNVALAASHIDGTVLYPGEEFSAEEVIGPTTEENGFLPGDTYENGKVTVTYGGGVCQTTSTLYRAVLEAELEVTERHNHSYLVSYVEPAFDAAIAEGLLDFKFVNNTDSPIYIQAVTEDGVLTFRIFGHETRDENRSIRYYSEIGEYTDIETKYVLDSSEEFGTMTASGGISGVDAQLYKIETIDGVDEEPELVNSSSYSMMPYTYTIGTKNADSSTLAALSQAVADESLSEIQSAIANGSTVSS